MAFFGPALVLLTLFPVSAYGADVYLQLYRLFCIEPEHNSLLWVFENIFCKTLFGDELFVTSFLNTVKFVVIIVPLNVWAHSDLRF